MDGLSEGTAFFFYVMSRAFQKSGLFFVKIHVCAGKIVGFSGLMGAGRTEMAMGFVVEDRKQQKVLLADEKELKAFNY